jgi:putative ABC transport system substrate-binding protein
VAELTETGTARFIVLLKELRRLGYVEGQNIAVERYSGAGRTEHSELASEVVRKKPDLILAITSRMVQNFKAATATIPIVGLMADPVPLGIVDSLARPGGNITGVCTDAGPEVLGKRLELLREVVPGISRVGLLTSRWVWEGPLGMAALRPAAVRMGVSIIGPPLEEGTAQEAEYQRVFDAMIQGRADAVIVGDGAANLTYRRLIVELAAKSRLPTIYAYREQVEVGGLMAYAPDLLDVYRRAAGYLDQILKGKKAGEIPIYLAVKFDLVVNLKAAKAIGLTVPPALLLRANEVIE